MIQVELLWIYRTFCCLFVVSREHTKEVSKMFLYLEKILKTSTTDFYYNFEQIDFFCGKLWSLWGVLAGAINHFSIIQYQQILVKLYLYFLTLFWTNIQSIAISLVKFVLYCHFSRCDVNGTIFFTWISLQFWVSVHGYVQFAGSVRYAMPVSGGCGFRLGVQSSWNIIHPKF